MRRLILSSYDLLQRNRFLQVALLAGFWLLGNGMAALLHLPVPGAVVGMVLMLVLLATGLVRLSSVRNGASWLLAEMLLFFVPSVLAILDHREFLGAVGLKIIAVIVIGTVMVMASTALTVDLCYRWRARHG